MAEVIRYSQAEFVDIMMKSIKQVPGKVENPEEKAKTRYTMPSVMVPAGRNKYEIDNLGCSFSGAVIGQCKA